jgi:hypothetical protein
VPLPRVDVGRPGDENLGVGAGGGRRGRSGVVRVTTTTPTVIGVLLVPALLTGAAVARLLGLAEAKKNLGSDTMSEE